ncbi:MAG: hypothetical protein ACF8XB_14465 [Planctomycetota bacterium JB042]
MIKTPLTSLTLGLLLSAPAIADDCQGTPGYHLDAIDSFVNGETLHVCLEAPPGQVVTILISANMEVTSSPYGNVCVDLFNGILNPVFVMPPSGKACYSEQYCKPITEDSTFFMQFVAVDPNDPSQAGVSNLETLTIEASDCYEGTPPDDDDCKGGKGGHGGKWGKGGKGDHCGKDDKDDDDGKCGKGGKWGKGGHDGKWGKDDDCKDGKDDHGKWGKGGHGDKWGKDDDDCKGGKGGYGGYGGKGKGDHGKWGKGGKGNHGWW